MSRNFDLATGPNYSINSVGSCSTLGNGAYTIIALFNINTGNNNCGLISFRTAGINAELFIDGNQIFGAGDFGGGQTGVTVSTWWWAAIRKAAGSSVYTYSLKPYASGSATHQNSAASHADSGATNTTIRLGDADDRGNGLIAVLAAWTSRLSDVAVAGMFTAAASDVAAQSPQGLWLGNQASSSDPMNDSAGTANQTSVNGAIGVGADPPAYNYSLGGAAAVWLPNPAARRRTQPPRRRPKVVTPVRAQVNPPYPFTGVKQPRRLRGRQPRRGEAFMPIPPQVVVVAPKFPFPPVRVRLRGLRLFRGRAAAPVPAQAAVTAPAYPIAPARARRRGIRAFRPRVSGPPADQLAPAGQQRPRLRLARIFRGRTAGPVLSQTVPVAPTYPPQPVRTRLRGLRLFRGRTSTPTPGQIVVLPPAYTPQALRPRPRWLRRFRSRTAAPPTAQATPVAPQRGRPHPVAPRRGHVAMPPLPQVAVVPPAYPPGLSRVKKRLARIFRGATRFTAWPPALAPTGTSSPTPEIVTRTANQDLTTGTPGRNLTTRSTSQNLTTQTTSRNREV